MNKNKEEVEYLNLDVFEKIILLNLLKPDNSLYASMVMEYMDRSLFKDPNIAEVFNLINKFYQKTSHLPNRTEILASISPEMESVRNALKSVTDSLKGMDLKYNMDQLLANTEVYIKQKKIHKLVEKCCDDYATKKRFDDGILNKEWGEINNISLTKDFGTDFVEHAQQFCTKLQQPDQYISTGFPNLDEMLGGGLFSEGKAFYCFSGETNVGKSIVMANLAWNIFESGKNVLLISLEMSEHRYYKRLATIGSSIAQAYISQKTGDFLNFVGKFKDKKNYLKIKEFPPRSISSRGLNAFMERMKKQKEFKPDVILVDYHGLMKPAVNSAQRHEVLQLITQELRALSYLHTAPIISVAQLNRSGHNSVAPGLDKTAGSWDMTQDMDFIVSIWQTDEDREINALRYSIQKTRDTGAKKKQGYFKIDLDTLKLTDIVDDKEILMQKPASSASTSSSSSEKGGNFIDLNKMFE